MLNQSPSHHSDSAITGYEPPIRLARARPVGLGWRMAAVSAGVMLLSIAAYPHLPRVYTAEAEVLLRPSNQDGSAAWDQSQRDALDDNAIQTKIGILSSDPLQMAVIEKHNLLNDPEFNSSLRPSWLRSQMYSLPWLSPWVPAKMSERSQVRSALIKHLTVKRDQKSYIIRFGYQSNDPVKSAALTNVLASSFLLDQIGRKRNSHADLLTALKERIDGLESQYRADEKTEVDFAKKTGVDHFGTKISMQQQIVSLSTALAEAHRVAVVTAAHAEMLGEAHRKGSVDITCEALSSGMLQRLQERLVELTAGAGAGNVPSGGSNAVIANLRQGIEAENQRLVKAAQSDAAAAQKSESSIQAEIDRVDAKMASWNADERKLFDLHRAVEIDLAAITAANNHFMQEAGRGDALQPDLEIVSDATASDRPSFPNPMLYAAGTLALIALFNGLLLVPAIRIARAR